MSIDSFLRLFKNIFIGPNRDNKQIRDIALIVSFWAFFLSFLIGHINLRLFFTIFSTLKYYKDNLQMFKTIPESRAAISKTFNKS